MRCPVCKEQGKKSRVDAGMGTTTLMCGASFYDEDGRYHNHDPNISTYDYRCSNGHSFQVHSRIGCWCDDHEGMEEVTVIEGGTS